MRGVPILCVALIACGSKSSHNLDAAAVTEHPDAVSPDGTSAVPDASTALDASTAPDASIGLDAGTSPDAAVQPDAGTPNTVSCYAQGAPSTTCTLPTHCCFTNYDSQHNGQCTSAACVWGTISCDGPEDCTGGQRCCAHAIIDPAQGLQGYTLACQAGPCGASPANEELCHTGTCSSGTCVTALGHNNDLPRSLSICQ